MQWSHWFTESRWEQNSKAGFVQRNYYHASSGTALSKFKALIFWRVSVVNKLFLRRQICTVNFIFVHFFWKLWLNIFHGWFYSYFLTVVFPHNGLNIFLLFVLHLFILSLYSYLFYEMSYLFFCCCICYTNNLNRVPMFIFMVERCWKYAAETLLYNEIFHSVYITSLGSACDRNCQWI